MHALEMLVPGDINTLTGGYEYDRRMLAGLRARRWLVRLHELDAGFPFPSAAALDQVAKLLATFPDDSRVLIDGLALGAMPAQACAAAARMQIVGLVHHPLALESGLSASQATHLRQSEQQALRCVARIIVTSAATAETLRAWGLADAAIRVVEPGTDAQPQAARDVQRLLRPGHVPRLLCV
ncbi:MAG: glycosyltransferase, partial [Steroidobacteraceae bacterium]